MPSTFLSILKEPEQTVPRMKDHRMGIRKTMHRSRVVGWAPSTMMAAKNRRKNRCSISDVWQDQTPIRRCHPIHRGAHTNRMICRGCPDIQVRPQIRCHKPAQCRPKMCLCRRQAIVHFHQDRHQGHHHHMVREMRMNSMHHTPYTSII